MPTTNVIKFVTQKQQQSIAKLYKDLGWIDVQQKAFNTRTCGHDTPRTTKEASKVIEGLKAIIARLLKPYHQQIRLLAINLYQGRYEMSPWERDTFLPDIVAKIEERGVGSLTPATVKKIRQIAHKYDVETGFPSLRDLGAEYSRAKVA